MRWPNFTRLCRYVCLIGFVIILIFPSPVSADSFVVNTTDDVDDGICDSSHCSLREAIAASNANPGADSVTFSGLDAGNGYLTIQLMSPLPAITDDNTMLNGTTVIGSSGTPLIQIRPDTSDIYVGFDVQSDDNTITGFSMTGFGSGVELNEGSLMDYGAILVQGSGNHITENVLGAIVLKNYAGVNLLGAGNTISSNVVSGNGFGVLIRGPWQSIMDNKIGVDAFSNVAIPNDFGIYTYGGGGSNQIGGSSAGEGNVVSGNNHTGIFIDTEHNSIYGNIIGLDANGSFAIPNGAHGISIFYAPNNEVGGLFPGEGNIISGNYRNGIFVRGGPVLIQGNKIGTDISGSGVIPNGLAGIELEGGPGIIGGFQPGMGNIIKGNGYHGIYLDDFGGNFMIYGNEIAENTYAGIAVNGTHENTFTQNSIFQNGGLGIDIEPMVEGNNGIEYPILQEGLGTTITGTACPNCIIEVYKADPDPTGYGEGKEFLNDGLSSSDGSFSIAVDGEFYCARITATATDADGNTSEFSQNIEANCVRLGPLYLIPIWSFTVVVFGALGIFVRRRYPNSSPWVIPGSFAVGFLVGGGLILLAGAQPNVIIGFKSEQSVPYSGQIPSCDTYLDPAAFSPQDGETLPLSDDVLLEWDVTDDLPDGAIRWTVALEEVGTTEGIGSTEGISLLMSAFGMTPVGGSSYEWFLYGHRQLVEGEDWLPFCGPSSTLAFQIEEADEEAVEVVATEEPAVCEPTLTALMNLTCRSGPLQAYDELGYLLEGESAVPEGQNEDGSWYWILNPDWQGHCWIWSGGVEATCIPNTLQLIAYDPLPTDTPEPPACNRELNRSECNIAGGIYRVGDDPFCECP